MSLEPKRKFREEYERRLPTKRYRDASPSPSRRRPIDSSASSDERSSRRRIESRPRPRRRRSDSSSNDSRRRSNSPRRNDYRRRSPRDDKSPNRRDEGDRRIKRSSNPEDKLTVTELQDRRASLLKKNFGYSDKRNPFGDSELSKPFIWNKLAEQNLKAKGHREIRASDYLRATERKVQEIALVSTRRGEREVEDKQRQEARAKATREREALSYEEWQKIEGNFHRDISKLRIRIRIDEGREEAFHYLLKAFDISLGQVFTNMEIPDRPVDELVKELSDAQVEQLLNDVRSKVKIDKQELEEALANDDAQQVDYFERSISYWRDAFYIVRWQLRDRSEKSKGRKELPFFVAKRLRQMLTKKSSDELDEISKSVETQLAAAGDGNVDVDFWEAVKTRLPYYRALTGCEVVRQEACTKERGGIPIDVVTKLKSMGTKAKETPAESTLAKIAPDEFDDEPQMWSPILVSPSDVTSSPPGDEIEESADEETNKYQINYENDDDLELLREPTAVFRTQHDEDQQDQNAIFDKFVAREKSLNNDDEMILEANDEVIPLTADNCMVLRRPRYFHRMRTGFEWNRYNQAHYDQENPPPRIVQGYKFALAYPDLLDKSSTPSWRLVPSDTDDNTVIIKFHAGPPYEDVAFKIINREWDINPKRGYRNSYDRGILQLYFNFKRLRYRK